MANDKAFPSKEIDFRESQIQQRTVYMDDSPGMDLRDYFAAKAIPAVYAEFMAGLRNAEHDYPGPGWEVGLAQTCYNLADAMMEARKCQS